MNQTQGESGDHSIESSIQDTPKLILSPLTNVRWVEDTIVISTPASSLTIETTDCNVLLLLHEFCRARIIDSIYARFATIPEEDLRSVMEQLVAASVLVPAAEVKTGNRTGALPFDNIWWEAHDLFFHYHSRKQGASDHRLASKVQPLPAVKPPMSSQLIDLPKTFEFVEFPFGEVIANRKSIREYKPEPIAKKMLSQFLFLSARNIYGPFEAKGAPGEYVSRPYPSGGSEYPLEIYPVLNQDSVEGISAGIYHYCPSRHVLEHLSSNLKHNHYFLKLAKEAAVLKDLPPVVLLITARFGRTSFKYSNLAYSLVLKELGCLFQTFYLVATALDLAPCALGGGDSDFVLAHLAGFDPWEEVQVGEFIVGPKRV